MTPGQITALRAGLVVVYTLIAAVSTHDGASAGDVVGLALLGGLSLVVILLADWINDAPRRKD